MYIVYLNGNSENMIFEEKEAAFEYAISLAHDVGVTVQVYKANLIATVELPTEPILIKIKKQRVPKPEVFEAAVEKIVKKKISKKVSLDPDLQVIAAETAIEEELPMGARCALDNNLAVGKRKGPTGEYVYLCVDCMGQLQ